MSIIGVPNLKASGVSEDTSRPKRWRDLLLKDVQNDGVRFAFDLAFPYSYPGGAPIGRPAAAAPVAGATVGDISDHANGSAAVATAGGIAYVGGGFDFTNSAASSGGTLDQGVMAPASALADIFAPFGGKSQRYLACLYCKLPALADWNATGTILSFFGDKSYSTSPSLFILAMVNGGLLQVRRQTGANAYDTVAPTGILPAAGDYGTVVQIAHWRSDAGQGLRLRSANGIVIGTRAMGADNTQDFSANAMCFGRNAGSFAGTSYQTVLPALKGFRVYRGFVENLARSGRDPVTVLDADYMRTMARGIFS